MKTSGRTVALITARGGSKRLPGKNVKPLGGKPLLEWTIQAALHSKKIDQVILSTDCEKIAQCGKAAGAEVPFIRPSGLAGDTSSHYSVISHAIKWLEKAQPDPLETMALLQPTSPFRTAKHIDAALTLREQKCNESLASVTAVTQHPAFMHKLSQEGHLTSYLPATEGYQRSQDQEKLFVLNGAIYIFSPEAFHQRETVLATSTLAFEMDAKTSLDIDDVDDFAMCEALLLAGGATE